MGPYLHDTFFDLSCVPADASQGVQDFIASCLPVSVYSVSFSPIFGQDNESDAEFAGQMLRSKTIIAVIHLPFRLA